MTAYRGKDRVSIAPDKKGVARLLEILGQAPLGERVPVAAVNDRPRLENNGARGSLLLQSPRIGQVINKPRREDSISSS